jgi:hypothetical protein
MVTLGYEAQGMTQEEAKARVMALASEQASTREGWLASARDSEDARTERLRAQAEADRARAAKIGAVSKTLDGTYTELRRTLSALDGSLASLSGPEYREAREIMALLYQAEDRLIRLRREAR